MIVQVILEELNGQRTPHDVVVRKNNGVPLEVDVLTSESRNIYGRSAVDADGRWIYRYRNSEPLPK